MSIPLPEEGFSLYGEDVIPYGEDVGFRVFYRKRHLPAGSKGELHHGPQSEVRNARIHDLADVRIALSQLPSQGGLRNLLFFKERFKLFDEIESDLFHPVFGRCHGLLKNGREFRTVMHSRYLLCRHQVAVGLFLKVGVSYSLRSRNFAGRRLLSLLHEIMRTDNQAAFIVKPENSKLIRSDLPDVVGYDMTHRLRQGVRSDGKPGYSCQSRSDRALFSLVRRLLPPRKQ